MDHVAWPADADDGSNSLVLVYPAQVLYLENVGGNINLRFFLEYNLLWIILI